MSRPSALVATWEDGLIVCAGKHRYRELAGQSVGALAPDGQGGVSGDGGKTWAIEREGLHASYCSAVAVLGDDILVAAATDHFAPQGAIYRRALHGRRCERVRGLPQWLDGIADTRCIATQASIVAIADRAGTLWLSTDSGYTWVRRASGLGTPSSVFLLPA